MKGFGPALALGGAALAGGCGPTAGTGDLTALSLGERPVLLGEPCVTAVYGRPGAETSFYLSTVPVPDLLEGRISEGVVIHIDLLWQPKAGVTPVDASATNVTIHYIVFAGGQVGVYGGSGFALPRGRLGSGRVGLSLMDASLTLLESTDGFVDLLSPARLTGALTASYDDEQARRVSRAVSQIVTNALGRSMFVQNKPGLFFGSRKTDPVCFAACPCAMDAAKKTPGVFFAIACREPAASPTPRK